MGRMHPDPAMCSSLAFHFCGRGVGLWSSALQPPDVTVSANGHKLLMNVAGDTFSDAARAVSWACS